MQSRSSLFVIFVCLFLLLQQTLASPTFSNWGRGGSGRGRRRHYPMIASQLRRNSSTAQGYSIGYYQGDASSRSCDAYPVSKIDTSKYTHINYAFADLLAGGSGNATIIPTDQSRSTIIRDLIGLKTANSALKVYAAVGGWGVPGEVFAAMVAAADSRKAFIDSAVEFLSEFEFDGLDVDWEYPGASDRGGTAADSANFVTFLGELRTALPTDKGLTITIPGGPNYLKGFDIEHMVDQVDWFNVMSYDLHGAWENPKRVFVHTNMTETTAYFSSLLSRVPASKLVLGLAFYGKTYTLADKSCTTPGCAFTAAGKAGPCTASAGVLSNKEIADIVAAQARATNLTSVRLHGNSTPHGGSKPVYDEASRSMYFSWDDQWVGYDNKQSIAAKKTFVTEKGLLGTQVWAIDQGAGDEF